MRAHFAGDVVASPTAEEVVHGKDAPQEDTLQERVHKFKGDAKNMAILTQFIDDVLKTAEAEAWQKKHSKNIKNSQQTKEKTRQSFTIPDFKNGKVVNRARGLVVRIFDAIGKACVGATPVPRMKLRGKRASASAGSNGTHDTPDKCVEAKDTKLKKLECDSAEEASGKKVQLKADPQDVQK